MNVCWPETVPNDVVAFVVYPNGETAGQPMRSGNGIVTSVSESNPAGGDMVTLSISVDVDGEIAKGTVSS